MTLLIASGHWHLVNNRLNSYIYYKNKIRLPQNTVNTRDVIRQNIFSYIKKLFLQLELYQIQETGRALFNYNIINTSKRPDKVFQVIHSTEKIGINFRFLPIFLFGRKQLASLASGEGSYTRPVHEKCFYTFVPVPFNNEHI